LLDVLATIFDIGVASYGALEHVRLLNLQLFNFSGHFATEHFHIFTFL